MLTRAPWLCFVVLAAACGGDPSTVPPGKKDSGMDEPDAPVDPGTGEGEALGCTGEPALLIDDADAAKAALAMGLCPRTETDEFMETDPDGAWGLLEARFTGPSGEGTPVSVQHGILPGFGPNVSPLQGDRILVLSTGTARAPGDPDYSSPMGTNHGTEGEAPPGFPIPFPACEGDVGDDTAAYDGAALELTIRAPEAAKSMRFNVNFYTFEFPEYVCSEYNDFFVVLQSPAPESAVQGNIAFDTMENPISVNNAFVEVCKPQVAEGKEFTCRLGKDQLSGTGFETHAATGWLEVRAPVAGGATFTLRLAIWDAGDHVLDSTVLVDNFRFDDDTVGKPVIVPVL